MEGRSEGPGERAGAGRRGRTRHAARQPRSPQRGAGGAVPGTAAGEKAAAPAMALAANRAAAFIVSSGFGGHARALGLINCFSPVSFEKQGVHDDKHT
jgi:hypothetical protein